MLSSDADVEMEATLKEFIQERSSVRVKGRGGGELGLLIAIFESSNPYLCRN